MCNRYGNNVSYRHYVESLKAAQIPLVSPGPGQAPNLQPRANIFPTDPAPVLRPVEGGLELVSLRWGLIPWFYKGGIKDWKVLTTNARSETITKTPTFKNAFATRRCLIPLNEFYEWTGPKGKKTKWSFSRKDKEWFCFAGIWDRAETAEGTFESYALVTIAAGGDVLPYHDRQPIMLERHQYQEWLQGPSRHLFSLPPAGLLDVAQAPSEIGREHELNF